MARKGNAVVEAPVEATEGTVSVSDAATEAPATESTEVELTGEQLLAQSTFASDAEAAVTSGEFETVQNTYNDLPRKAKTAATKWVNDQMVSALRDKGDKDLAVAWVGVQECLKSRPTATRTSTPRTPVDPTEGFVERLVGLSLAYTIASEQVPEGLKADWVDTYNAKLAEAQNSGEVAKLIEYRNSTDENKGDAPEVSTVVARAVRLAFQGTSSGRSSGGSGSTYSGPRRSISKHIEEAFASHPSGTFLTVGELHNFTSSEYGSDKPSAGAISAALKSGKSLPEGISMSTGGAKNTVGAIKA